MRGRDNGGAEGGVEGGEGVRWVESVLVGVSRVYQSVC